MSFFVLLSKKIYAENFPLVVQLLKLFPSQLSSFDWGGGGGVVPGTVSREYRARVVVLNKRIMDSGPQNHFPI